MEKRNELKLGTIEMYEAPVVEIVEVRVEKGVLLTNDGLKNDPNDGNDDPSY